MNEHAIGNAEDSQDQHKGYGFGVKNKDWEKMLEFHEDLNITYGIYNLIVKYESSLILMEKNQSLKVPLSQKNYNNNFVSMLAGKEKNSRLENSCKDSNDAFIMHFSHILKINIFVQHVLSYSH